MPSPGLQPAPRLTARPVLSAAQGASGEITATDCYGGRRLGGGKSRADAETTDGSQNGSYVRRRGDRAQRWLAHRTISHGDPAGRGDE